jgi:uncharacterized membrane protein YtjA (UPF0391 family)
MLGLALFFFIIAIIAALFGFGVVAGVAAGAAKIFFIIFIILAILSLLGAVVRGGRGPLV